LRNADLEKAEEGDEGEIISDGVDVAFKPEFTAIDELEARREEEGSRDEERSEVDEDKAARET